MASISTSPSSNAPQFISMSSSNLLNIGVFVASFIRSINQGLFAATLEKINNPLRLLVVGFQYLLGGKSLMFICVFTRRDHLAEAVGIYNEGGIGSPRRQIRLGTSMLSEA